MSKRLLALLFAGLISLAGLAVAQGPPATDEPPVRLKKKKPRGNDKPMVEPDKPDEKKKDDKKDEKKTDKKDEPREAEPVTRQEEEKEVLQRVVQNVHRVDERLAKNDLGEATQQTQRDILKDLESLIQRNENPPPQGGDQQNQQGGGGGQSGMKSGAGKRSVTRQQRGRGQSGSGKRVGQENMAGAKAAGKNGKNGNGGGGDKDDHARNKNADQYKDIWGHLPQTLRAKMDAYSNPQPFMPKYDDLIKRYYRTIAEQGRRKGE
ncbi:MAG TPA: hypothetical protein VMF69_07010 [Gemmataceae bacterium]|nr:hypothetical protein [Gemmataceae bacterium]